MYILILDAFIFSHSRLFLSREIHPRNEKENCFSSIEKKVQKRKENDKKNNKQKFKENVKIFSTPLSASLK